MESICKAGVSLLRVTINCLVFEGSAWCHILALGTYTILLKQKSLWWSFQIQEDKLKKVKFGNCIAAARNYRNCTRLSLMTSRWPSEVHADFIPPPPRDVRGDGGGGVYLKGVTFNVRVKCLYDDTNSLPTKYTVFKPKMAQKQNLFDLQIKLYYKDLNYYPFMYFPTISKTKIK